MDSDDEFMSGLSSQEEEEEFGGTEESDDGSLGDGTHYQNSDGKSYLILWFQNIEFDDDEPDSGFSQEKDITKPARKPYEVDFKVYGPDDIQAHQDNQIQELSAILGQPPESSAILLRYFRWNKERLIEAYMERQDEVLEKAGLGGDAGQAPKTKIIKGFTCDICFENESGMETYALKCAHRYCITCYGHYLFQKIKEEGEAARIQCPTEGCTRIVDSKSLELLVMPELKARYVELPSSKSVAHCLV